MPQPSSMMEGGEEVCCVRKGVRGFEGEESHSAKRGVIFQRTFVMDC